MPRTGRAIGCVLFFAPLVHYLMRPIPAIQKKKLWDEFFRIRQVQDQALNDRFRSIDNSIHEVKQGLEGLTVEVRAQFAKIDVQFANIDAQFKEVRIESQRMAARFHNSTLKNPAMRIVPVFILDSFGEIASPDSKNFPRNAKEFYSMRDNPNKRLTRMLHYLVGFDDVQLDHQELSHSDSEAIDDVSPGQRVDTTWVAVEMLESILGLNEENFIKFKERAAY